MDKTNLPDDIVARRRFIHKAALAEVGYPDADPVNLAGVDPEMWYRAAVLSAVATGWNGDDRRGATCRSCWVAAGYKNDYRCPGLDGMDAFRFSHHDHATSRA